MERDNLLRLAISFQNSNASTIDKYICKISETIFILNNNKPLNAMELLKKISEEFNLIFSELEITNALQKRSKGRIENEGKLYFLNQDVFDKELSQDLASCLKRYCTQFLENEPCDEISSDELYQIIIDYLYFSFNSNTEIFKNIISGRYTDNIEDFECTSDRIAILNNFLNWNNIEKNKTIFSIVSFSYEYCMLTMKKNPTINEKMFSGKSFSLDTNLIIRLAGFNNEDRQYVINNFVKKCKIVGIKLYYTSKTYDELFRVIRNNISYIQKISKSQFPLDPQILQASPYFYELNDFYLIYYRWAKNNHDCFNDFELFYDFLISSITAVLDDIIYIDTNEFLLNEEQILFINNLKDYKDSILKRFVSNESIETDIHNYFYVQSKRKKSQYTNINDTKDFFISADQNLIAWEKKNFSGMPVVVAPSVWTSIILKYNGRSVDDEDYKSFCLFLNIRNNDSISHSREIDCERIIDTLSKKTTDAELKNRILIEIKNEQLTFKYSSDYDTNIEYAFDNVLKKEKNVSDKELIEVKQNLMEKIEQIEDEKNKDLLQQKFVSDEKMRKLSQVIVNKKIKKYQNILNLLNYIALVFVILVSILLICFIFSIKFRNTIFDILKISNFNEATLFSCLGMLAICIGGAYKIFKDMIQKRTTEEYRNKLIENLISECE